VATGTSRRRAALETPLSNEQQRALNRFASHLRGEGLLRSTREKYGENVAHFLHWLGERDPATVKRGEIKGYLEAWQELHEDEHGKPYKVRTVKARISALKKFYAYLDERELLVDETGREIRNPMDGIKAPKIRRKPNDWLREEEDQALLRAEMNRQERIVIFLLRWSGLRVSEACSLLWDDVDFTTGRIRVRESKSDAGLRQIPLAPELETELRAWKKHLVGQKRFAARLPVLITRNRTPMSMTFAWRLVKRVANRAGVRPHSGMGDNISEVTPHTLRRTFGSYLLNKGLRLEDVSKPLGHSNIRVTQECYAELLDKTVEERFHAVLSAG
jgi:site-specific recombinase XerD